MWTVLQEGCIASDGTECAILRGGVFDVDKSATWVPVTASPNGTDTFNMGLDKNLGYSTNGKYGYDTVALGWPGSGGPSLDHQVVGGIATKEFYLGHLGLPPNTAVWFSRLSLIVCYLSTLKDQSMIPSLSWAYTAGNQYRLNKALGSLTLGGYDRSKSEPDSLSVAFNEQDIRDLTVNVKAIFTNSQDNTERTELLDEGFPAFIDSTIPYLYLPLESCLLFEKAFGITWNESVLAYLVNDSLRNTLLTQNPSIVFTLSNSTSGSSRTIDVELPYAAFDLIAEPPLVNNATRYFPLMRAANESQYTLGRTFLQEAYLIADYERRNFSVSPCSWKEGVRQDIMPILSPELGLNEDRQLLQGGALAGVVIGCIIASLCIAFALFYLVRRRKRRVRLESKLDRQESSEASEIQEVDPANGAVLEVDGEPLPKPELHGRAFERYEVDGGIDGHNEAEGSSALPYELEVGRNRSVELPCTKDDG
ncbi:MAG: hypothetical protein Q9174_003895 [Haloplaca sp. 1 TL-2023]